MQFAQAFVSVAVLCTVVGCSDPDDEGPPLGGGGEATSDGGQAGGDEAPTAGGQAPTAGGQAPTAGGQAPTAGGQAGGGPAPSAGGAGPLETGGTGPTDEPNPTAAGAGGSGGAPSDDEGQQDEDANSAGRSLPTPDCPQPAELGVHIVGRHDGCQAGAVRYSWSGSGFVARFEGTGLRFTQSGNSVEYTVIVDGTQQPKLLTTSGEGTYAVASELSPGEHTVEVYRRGEASFGASVLLSVEAIEGQLLTPPPAPERRIEIFGDSITCGYGNEGIDASCSFTADTENHYLTYGAILARHFEAELSTVAWSGKGAVVNYNGDMGTTLTDMVDRAEPNSASSVWDYRLAQPADLVIVNLGTNDYSTDHDPSSAEFQSGYEQLLSTLRARYPDAYILCTLGPLLGGSDLDTARANIAAAVAARNDAGDARVQTYELAPNNPDPGCDWHPSLATHEAMADELKPVVATALGW